MFAIDAREAQAIVRSNAVVDGFTGQTGPRHQIRTAGDSVSPDAGEFSGFDTTASLDDGGALSGGVIAEIAFGARFGRLPLPVRAKGSTSLRLTFATYQAFGAGRLSVARVRNSTVITMRGGICRGSVYNNSVCIGNFRITGIFFVHGVGVCLCKLKLVEAGDLTTPAEHGEYENKIFKIHRKSPSSEAAQLGLAPSGNHNRFQKAYQATPSKQAEFCTKR
jgi:hypothetical protein